MGLIDLSLKQVVHCYSCTEARESLLTDNSANEKGIRTSLCKSPLQNTFAEIKMSVVVDHVRIIIKHTQTVIHCHSL